MNLLIRTSAPYKGMRAIVYGDYEIEIMVNKCYIYVSDYE